MTSRPFTVGIIQDSASADTGLASVPGVVRAARYRNSGTLDAGPRSHAIYDMVARDTFESPPWLKVRHSPWTARVVPMWRNTKRTMLGRTMLGRQNA